MPTSASKVFDFLQRNEEVTIERHEIAMTAFSILRRSLRQIVLKLHDSYDQEARDISYRLRILLSEWLTVPVPFGHLMQDAVSDLFGEDEAVPVRWGSDICELYDTAKHAAEDLKSSENPVRTKLRKIINDLRSQELAVRIYCHRKAKPHFLSIPEPPEHLPLEEKIFLHSVRNYRETEPFDALIKVGALRSRGWGSAPDAILTAPRFNSLIQVVWSGCNDEADFGYDPGMPHSDSSDVHGGSPLKVLSSQPGSVKWTRQVIHFGEDASAFNGKDPDEDELHLFREIGRQQDNRPAIHLQISETHGILYPPHARILSFDPKESARRPIDHRIPGETLVEGLFLIMPIVDEIDFGGVRAEHGHYSKIWKAKLKQEFRNDSIGLIRRLRSAGLNLMHLGAAIQHWCKPPSTVIHAPQQMKHFEILLRILDLNNVNDKNTRKRTARWWQIAWNEIRRSRGEAIQAGVQAQEIVEEQLMETLKKFMPQITEKSLEEANFRLDIPAGDELEGYVFFLKVCNIEDGFRAPETELKIVREVNLIDQWRE